MTDNEISLLDFPSQTDELSRPTRTTHLNQEMG